MGFQHAAILEVAGLAVDGDDDHLEAVLGQDAQLLVLREREHDRRKVRHARDDFWQSAWIRRSRGGDEFGVRAVTKEGCRVGNWGPWSFLL